MRETVAPSDSDILNGAASNSIEGGPSFTLSNRAYRAVFGLFWTVLAGWTPRPFCWWRRWVLQLFGARLHPTARVYGGVNIWSPRNLTMARNAVIGPGATIYSMAQITLEEGSIVSQGAHLCAGSHDVESPHFQLNSRPITIQRRAWVAADAFVAPGVTIGEGAVLGARGCAFKDLEPWTIYGGNPAFIIKPRLVRF